MKSARADFMLIKLTDCESKDCDIKTPGFDLTPHARPMEFWNGGIMKYWV